MRTYLQFLPPTFTGLTGTQLDVRRNADAWSVRYAKEIDAAEPGGYGMAHTSDIFLVDAAGVLRAQFRYGTPAATIAAALTPLVARPAPPAAPSSPTAAPASPQAAAMGPMGNLRATVVSTSIWAGGQSPVILSLADAMGMPLDGSTPVAVRVVGADGVGVGPDVRAVAIRPAGERQVSYVANVDIPSPGSWRLDVIAADGTSGSVTIDVLDQGASARLGGPAPLVDTPTLEDVGGNLLAISTAAAVRTRGSTSRRPPTPARPAVPT